MTKGVVGRKLGMSRVFMDDGSSTPVTVIEVQPNRVTAVRTPEANGYTAYQVTSGVKSAGRLNKPETGHFAKASVSAGLGLTEFRVNELDVEIGGEITLEIFAEGQKVDVSGTSIGKGFAGTVKRHNFAMQDATHGNSLSHRAPGSIGQNQTPGRVFKGKKMAGHMGAVKTTVQGLKVVRVDADRNVLLVKGAVPGAKGGELIIRPSVKA